MIFEDWELNEVCKALQDSESISGVMISAKIKQLQQTSKNKRYSLRTTDWLSESAKKQKNKKKKNIAGGLI